MKIWLSPLLIITLGLFGACSPKGGKAGASGNHALVANSTAVRHYSVRGLVRSELTEDNSVTIEHEDIPGFMPSMTMPFILKDRREFAGVSVGDAVEFELTLGENESWIAKIRKIQVAEVHLSNKREDQTAATDSAERLHEGEKLPDFRLTDQSGRQLTRSSIEGKSMVMTFIFTRCPIPNFCPMMSKNFSELQKEIGSDPTLKGQVQLLSVSFDPEHDTPTALTQYGLAFTRDLESWKFATGSSAEINRLTSEFSVYIKAEGGTISHGLCTALISPDGTIAKIWRGNGWEPGEVMEALHQKVAKR